MDLRLEAETLFHSSYANSTSFAHFLHDPRAKIASFSAKRMDGINLTATLRDNGIFNLIPEDTQNVNGKIQYAFMGSEFHFSNTPEGKVNPMTSNFPHIRVCYHLLCNDERKDTLLESVRKCFPNIIDIEVVKPENKVEAVSALMVTENDVKLEIRAMGAAFQKVFTAFVLLQLLLLPRNTAEDVIGKYFLLEEPEALLHPTIVAAFYNEVRRLCADEVNLIVVSNSAYVINSTPDHFPLC